MSEDYIATLNDLTQRAAATWTPSDLGAIVQGFREQRERWNIEQAAGSRKLVRSSQVATPLAPSKPPTAKSILKGLSL